MLFSFENACIGHNSEDYIDSKGPDPSLRKGRDLTLDLGPKLHAKGPDAAYAQGAGYVHIYGPNPLNLHGADCFKQKKEEENLHGADCFKQKKEEENRAKKDADNMGLRNFDVQHCHIEVVDEAVWNERQGGVCNTLMQALCARPARVKETEM